MKKLSENIAGWIGERPDEWILKEWLRDALVLESSVPHTPTLRDQFAMHILPSLMLRWKEPGYTESGAVAEAYSIADTMIECRKANPARKDQP